MKLINFRLPEELYQEIVKVGQLKDRSVSYIIRLAVEEFIKNSTAYKPEKSNLHLLDNLKLINFRLDDDIYQKILVISQTEDRSVSYVIRTAVKTFLYNELPHKPESLKVRSLDSLPSMKITIDETINKNTTDKSWLEINQL